MCQFCSAAGLVRTPGSVKSVASKLIMLLILNQNELDCTCLPHIWRFRVEGAEPLGGRLRLALLVLLNVTMAH